ncbi:MAG: Nif3-like dinuclear metal center hexameric protein [Oscillospiraceae bacterium]|jgi:dinuclear metal center YbgI/SA1388 family protein|nr:Nif3-like dinuclear metal center hexameric protein [Oscillospiraceae bacterium]
MITVNDIEKALFGWAPLSLATKGDKVGLQTGERSKSVRRVLVSLDVTQAVIREAVFTARADLIVSHHGILRDETRPTDDTDAGLVLLTLCQTGVASIAMHTNLDAAKGGVNDVLAERIGLVDVRVFNQEYDIGHIGRLPAPMSVQDFAAQCKAAVKTGVVRYYDAGKTVQTVALCSGGGGFLLEDAIKAGCDTFVTGDVKHSQFLTAQNQGVNLLCCGHFATENVVVPVVAAFLQKRFPDLEVLLSGETSEPFQCL